MSTEPDQVITVTLVFTVPAGTLPRDEPFDHDTLDWLQANFELTSMSARDD
jgi:hypothetical protein